MKSEPGPPMTLGAAAAASGSWKRFIGPPEGLVNSRLGQHVGRAPVGLADELGHQQAFAPILPQHRGEREGFDTAVARSRNADFPAPHAEFRRGRRLRRDK
jgi:hypothetical protein